MARRYNEDEFEEADGDAVTEEEEVDTAEEAFMIGYNDRDKVKVCDECGEALRDKKTVLRKIDGEKHRFCSEICADDYEESLG